MGCNCGSPVMMPNCNASARARMIHYYMVRAIQNVHEAEKICYMWLYIF